MQALFKEKVYNMRGIDGFGAIDKVSHPGKSSHNNENRTMIPMSLRQS